MRGFPSREFVARIKEGYPFGTKIRLHHMNDPYAPVLPNTEGGRLYHNVTA